MDRLISKILNYESSIFEEYITKREKVVCSIKNMRNLNKNQELVFIHDLKEIIDPIKMSINGMDHYLSNIDFIDQKNINLTTDISLLYLLIGLRFNGIRSESESELISDTDTLETEISSESVSDSVSLSV